MRRLAVLAVLALGLATTPASAATTQAVALAPSPMASTSFAGSTCALATSEDHGSHRGVIEAGPFTVFDPTASVLVVSCTVQINESHNPSGGVTRLSASSGGAGVLTDSISYSASSGDDVYVCTALWWCDATGCTHVYVDDDDQPANGSQCALASSAEV